MFTSHGALAMICVTTITYLVKANSCNCPGVHKDFHTITPHVDDQRGEVQEQVNERHRKRCCPYDFDGKFCRYFGNRILCGYNRNIGIPNANDEEVNLNNGCRIRNGRLECGYDQAPYINFRRPPGWDNQEQLDKTKEEYRVTTTESMNIIKLQYKTFAPKYTTQCLEIRERIVCKTI